MLERRRKKNIRNSRDSQTGKKNTLRESHRTHNDIEAWDITRDTENETEAEQNRKKRQTDGLDDLKKKD